MMAMVGDYMSGQCSSGHQGHEQHPHQVMGEHEWSQGQYVEDAMGSHPQHNNESSYFNFNIKM